MLALFAFLMAWESVDRLFLPVAIVFNEAIVVAFVGLAVNAASVMIMEVRDQDGASQLPAGHRHGDHNLRAAYLHVLADAVTLLLVIFALLAGKFFGFVWMDPLMGIVGAVLVARWSWGLLRDSGGVLLDRQAPSDTCERIRSAI